MKAQGIAYKVKPAFVFGTDTTYEHNREVEIPITSATYINPIQIDWGDGTVENYSSGTYLSHTYDTDDDDAEYTIRITSASGKLPVMVFGDGTAAIGTHPKVKHTIKEVQYCNSKKYTGSSIATSLGSIFYYCGNLTYIHGGIFRNDTSVTSLVNCFCRTGIENIYQGFLKHCVSLRDAGGIFASCSSLSIQLSDKLFYNNPNIISFQYTFSSTAIYGQIPTGLFDNNPDVTRFDHTFNDCSGLTGSIPDGLFDNNTAVTSFSSTFSGCTGITSIPSGLFDNNTAVTSFSSTFSGCTGITSIPGGLFDNNTAATNFDTTFYLCSGLTSIPDGLFDNNTAATSFASVFNACTHLTGSIPDGFFKNNNNITYAGFAFSMCSRLTGAIPEDMFDGCTALANVSGIFSGCSSLTSVSQTMFDDCPLVNVLRVFQGCSSLTGTAPELWNTTQFPSITSYSRAFESCTNLTNYADIPDGWK